MPRHTRPTLSAHSTGFDAQGKGRYVHEHNLDYLRSFWRLGAALGRPRFMYYHSGALPCRPPAHR
jgi:hypothetical protein